MNYCLICHNLLPVSESWFAFLFPKFRSPLCENCSGELEMIEGEICQRCGRPLEGIPYKQGDTCLDCLKWQEQGDSLSCNRSIYIYNDFMKEVLARFKFRGDVMLTYAFSSPLRAAYTRYFSSYCVVPIPLSENRLQERGFNQAAVLANLLRTPVYDRIFIRAHGEKQSKKSRTERIISSSPFQVVPSVSLPSKSILLIDDIYTTGTTVRQAAALLRERGAINVSSLTLARSKGK